MENFSEGAEWSTRYKNDLPDSAFLYIEAGGKKDSEGKIKPRSLRHFPYKDMDGKVDRAHILNAIARIPQAKFLSQAQKDRLQARARQIYLKFVKYNSKKANSYVELISRLTAAVDLNPTNPVAQEIYDILVRLYSKNKCVMEALGALTIWSSKKRGDWKPDFLKFLNKIASDMTPANGPAPFYDTLMATLMAEGHKWFEGYAAECFRSPTVASDTSLDVIRRTMKDIQMTGDSMAEPYLPPSNAPEWQNDLSFQMLINGIYIPPSFSSNQEKMRCLYNFFRDMVMIEPPMNQNQQRQILNLFMVWSECLGRAG